MKKFLAVLKFELSNYFKNKSYLLTTGIISALLIVVLCVPSFIDVSGLIPSLGVEDSTQKEEEKETDIEKFAILDTNKTISDINVFKTSFKNSEWQSVNNERELEALVNEGEVKAGFIIKSPTEYSYLVQNTGFTDGYQAQFESILSYVHRQSSIENAGMNFEQVEGIYNTQIKSDVQILGKDSVSNYMYTYILLFVIYMMILIYGQTIAISVTSEKSNRAIEVLVTSTSSNSLIFGKVIAGAIASIMQVGIIMGAGIITYGLNKTAWNGILDNVFNIPTNMIIAFALFGVVGYLFYSFMFGALGALVSKTEDVSKSVGPVMMIFVAVFLISIMGMTSSDSMLIKVASFVPFSSPMAMLVRIAMGTVATMEIAISFVILAVTTVLTGLGGAKVYRLATLMYGNPIKLKSVFKWFKKEK